MNQPSIEEGVNALVSDVKHRLCESREHWENRVRESPGKAVMVALVAGYCLHRLPLRALFITKMRLMAALAPPAMLAIGAAKLCEFLQEQARAQGKGPPARARVPAGEDAGLGASSPGF